MYQYNCNDVFNYTLKNLTVEGSPLYAAPDWSGTH